MTNWYDGTVLADHAHRQQHGFDTWDNEQWAEVYGDRSALEVHDRDHEMASIEADLNHHHFCLRGQQVETPHDHAACVLSWLKVTV
jgi:hypothetical protein